MDSDESSRCQLETHGDDIPVPCEGCETAFRSPDQHSASFLLLGQLTTPVVGCDDHVETFADICGYTTESTAQLLDHRPAGGIPCPGCRLAHNNPRQPIIPVEDGAVAVLACPEHQSELLTRFQTGLETRQQLTTELGSRPDVL
jgi:hypothetical protein